MYLMFMIISYYFLLWFVFDDEILFLLRSRQRYLSHKVIMEVIINLSTMFDLGWENIFLHQVALFYLSIKIIMVDKIVHFNIHYQMTTNKYVNSTQHGPLTNDF